MKTGLDFNEKVFDKKENKVFNGKDFFTEDSLPIFVKE